MYEKKVYVQLISTFAITSCTLGQSNKYSFKDQKIKVLNKVETIRSNIFNPSNNHINILIEKKLTLRTPVNKI